ncbi:nitrous oxide reductase accessory protein NosL [Aeromonas media]|uniref:nitrous oxide reductase accessory protein NosL n=1 Tax=Aeromonas media TaxID=651 RepID=UPI00209BFAC6|nr:nitrous oxide reductase accessory protein NosL [Aeromonas media]
MLNSNNFYLKGSLMALLLALAGCNDVDSNPHVYDPVAFHSGDECHICGMAITGFPGPKGEAVAKTGCDEILLYGRDVWLVAATGEPGTRCHPVCA